MNTTLKRTSNEAKLTIIAEESDFAPIIRDVYNRLRPSVTAKGFRPGRAPNNIIDKELGVERVQAEVLEAAAERFYRQGLKEHDLHPVTNPHVEVKKFVPYTEAEIEITVEVMPEVTLGEYKKVKVKKEEAKVEESEVEQVLSSLQERLAEREEVKRAAKKGDEVEIDFHGKKDGQDVPGAQATHYPLQLGSDRFIPGFEAELIGLKAGDEKTFTITFPNEYGEASLAGAEVEFSVKVHKVSELMQPQLNDEFAKKAGPFESLDKLKEDVRAHLASEKDQTLTRQFENDVVSAVVDQSKVDLPQTMLERERERLAADFERSLAEQGLSKKAYLEQVKQTEKEHEKELSAQAEKRVKTALVLTKLAEAEKLQVTPEELEIRTQVLAGQYQDEKIQEELQKPEVRREIANQMLAEKTVAQLVSYAEEKPSKPKADAKPDTASKDSKDKKD